MVIPLACLFLQIKANMLILCRKSEKTYKEMDYDEIYVKNKLREENFLNIVMCINEYRWGSYW
jgi:hypothetical protein